MKKPKYKYDIDGQQFRCKAALQAHVKSILHAYKEHEELSPDDLRFMVSFLGHHKHADQKIGVGVKRMWVQQNGVFPTKGFWLERLDGTKTDFSYMKTLSHPTNLADFKAACRAVIADEVIRFKDAAFSKGKVVCPVEGRGLSKGEAHIDHAPPDTFEKIVSDFIREEGIDVEAVSFMDTWDGKVGTYFTEDTLCDRFLKYHNARAVLRVISTKANLSITKKGKNVSGASL